MKRLFSLLSIASLLLASVSAFGQEKPPAWAYPVNPPDFKAPPDDGTPRKVPDSSLTLTLPQVRDLFFAPDWHPTNHPAPPDVARGRNLTYMRAAFVTAPTVRAARRMQT